MCIKKTQMRVCTRFTPEDNRRLEGRGLMMLMRGVQIKIMMHNTTVDLRLTERRYTHTHARAYKRTHTPAHTGAL